MTKYTSDDWCTPKDLADLLGSFIMDPCSNDRSHIQAIRSCRNERRLDNGLTEDWFGSVFCNPPYSNVTPWADKLSRHRGTWVALVKLDPTTRWYHRLRSAASGWGEFRKRIKFERPDKPPLTANFPSVLFWNDWWPCPELEGQLWVSTHRAAQCGAV